MKICSIIIQDKKSGGKPMGFKREFNFEEDMELLNMKYQINNSGLFDYFQKELGANEPIQIGNEIEKTKNES